jgi:hypothetical protein
MSPLPSDEILVTYGPASVVHPATVTATEAINVTPAIRIIFSIEPVLLRC